MDEVSPESSSEEGNGGGESGINIGGRVINNNQEEDSEEGASAYGSDDFDDPSQPGAMESEDDSAANYGFGEDDQSSIRPTTEDSSTTRSAGMGNARPGATTAEREAERRKLSDSRNTANGTTWAGGVGGAKSMSSYADEFVDEDSSTPPRGQQTTATPASAGPGSTTETSTTTNGGSSASGNSSSAEQHEGRGQSGDSSVDAIASTSSPAFHDEGTTNVREPTNGGSNVRGGGGWNHNRRRSSGSERNYGADQYHPGVNTDFGDSIRVAPGGGEERGRGGGAVDNPPLDAVPSVRELEDRLREADMENSRLREAIRNSEAADAAGEGSGGGRKEFEILKSQVEAARAMLLSSLDEDDDTSERSLLELVLLAESRGYKQAEQNANSGEGKRRKISSTAAAAAAKAESIARAELEKRVESLERDLTRAVQEGRDQSARAASLQRQLDVGSRGEGERGSGQCRDGIDGGVSRGAEGGLPGGFGDVAEGVATADIMALKVKVTQLVERLRQEKAMRLKAERKAEKITGKVQVLSDHIEKLMMFLKHEATEKAKAHEQQRRLQKELELVKARSTALLRSNQAKDRVRTELREGAKILEDQLRLMDEKYMELRTKLDWTRTKADKDVRRARAKASALRTKWALLCGDGGGGGETSLLDAIRVDSPALNHSPSAPGAAGTGGGGGGGGGSSINAVGGHSKFNTSQQSQHHGGGGAPRGGGSPPIARGAAAAAAAGAATAAGAGVAPQRGGRGGALAPNMSEPSLSSGRHRIGMGVGSSMNVANGGGNSLKNGATPVVSSTYAGGGLRGGGSPPGGVVAFNPGGGLSAGTDPGGGILSEVGKRRGGSGSGGGPRPPWSEQGGGKGPGGGSHHKSPQVLFA